MAAAEDSRRCEAVSQSEVAERCERANVSLRLSANPQTCLKIFIY